MKKNKLLVFVVAFFIFSFSFIILNGKTYIVKYDNLVGINNIDDFDIKVEDENIVKVIDKKLDKSGLKVKLKSKNEGKTYIVINNLISEGTTMYSIYVHKFGIISFNEFMGNCNGGIFLLLSIIVLFLYLLILLVMAYKKSLNISMYQYKNIFYLGAIVFVFVSIITQLFSLFNFHGFVDVIDAMLSMFSFATVLLPVFFIVSILMIFSNILLIRKEGFNFRNVLGIFLGVFLCFTTFLPDLMYHFLYFVNWIDVHNQNGFGLYIYSFVESFIFIFLTYIECLLIGTMVMVIKTSRYIPKFDKDAILILGCRIKKDGSLTNLLKGRVDKAIEFGKKQREMTNKEIIYVPSGGKGNDEVMSEAQAMKKYLLSCGIKKENILVEDKSKNTNENIMYSNNIINKKIKNAKIIFSTTNYHVFRAGCIAYNQGLNIEGIGAKTKLYFSINAFIREFMATLINERKKHIIVIFSIIFVVILLIFLKYLNSNI